MKIGYFTLFASGFIAGVINLAILIPISILFILFRRKYFLEVTIFVASICLGIIYTNNWNERIEKDIEINSNETVVEGEVIEIADRRIESKQFIVKIKDGSTNIFVNYYNPEPEVSVGDRIIVNGSVRNLESLDEGYRNYLESKKIHLQMIGKDLEVNGTNQFRNVFYRINQYISKELEQNLDFEIASFNQGLLIGKDPILSEGLEESVKNLGLSHILSASGFNIGLVYILLNYVLSFDIKKKRILILLFVWIYTLIIGLESIGTLRATLMLTYVLISLNQGRKQYFSNSILFSALIILLIYPFYYLNVSFQLSVAATIGIFYVSKPIKNFFDGLFENKKVSELASLTLAAIISTYPIVLYHFGSSQPGNLLANIIVAPIVPVLTVYSALLVVLSSLQLQLFADFLSITISGLTQFTFMLLEKINSFGLAKSTITLFLAMFILKYANRTYKNFLASLNS